MATQTGARWVKWTYGYRPRFHFLLAIVDGTPVAVCRRRFRHPADELEYQDAPDGAERCEGCTEWLRG